MILSLYCLNSNASKNKYDKNWEVLHINTYKNDSYYSICIMSTAVLLSLSYMWHKGLAEVHNQHH